MLRCNTVNNLLSHKSAFSLKQAKLFYYQLPFSSPINFNGQKLSFKEGLILQVQDSHQQFSYGEIAPLPGFSHETLQQAKAQIISLLNNGLEGLQASNRLYPSVNFAVDAALKNISLTQVTDNLDTISLLQGDNNAVIKHYTALHCPPIVKLKVARQTMQDDILLFKQLGLLNPALKIRCDANQAWSATQASYFFQHIDKKKLDYIEEPTANHQLNLQLASQYQIALALDETLQDTHFHYQHNPCIKALVLKPSLIGSLKRLQYFINIAEQYQLNTHISSSFESIIGLQQLTALANIYSKTCSLSLGVDTLKYFTGSLLIDKTQIKSDLQKLECLWNSD